MRSNLIQAFVENTMNGPDQNGLPQTTALMNEISVQNNMQLLQKKKGEHSNSFFGNQISLVT